MRAPTQAAEKSYKERLKHLFDNPNNNFQGNDFSSLYQPLSEREESPKGYSAIFNKNTLKRGAIFVAAAVPSSIAAYGNWNSCIEASKSLYSGISSFSSHVFGVSGFYTNDLLYITNIFNFFNKNKWRAIDWSATSPYTKFQRWANATCIVVSGGLAAASPGIINATVAKAEYLKESINGQLTSSQAAIVYIVDGGITFIVNIPLHLMFLANTLSRIYLPFAHAGAARNVELTASKFLSADPATGLEVLYNALSKRKEMLGGNAHQDICDDISSVLINAQARSTSILARLMGYDYDPNLTKMQTAAKDYLLKLPQRELAQIISLLAAEQDLKPETAAEKAGVYGGYTFAIVVSLLGSLIGNWESLKKFMIILFGALPMVSPEPMPTPEQPCPPTSIQTWLAYALATIPLFGKSSIYGLSFVNIIDSLHNALNRLRIVDYVKVLPASMSAMLVGSIAVTLGALPSGVAYGNATGEDFEKMFGCNLQQFAENYLGDYETALEMFLIYYAWSCATGVNVTNVVKLLTQYAAKLVVTLGDVCGKTIYVPGNDDINEALCTVAGLIRSRAFDANAMDLLISGFDQLKPGKKPADNNDSQGIINTNSDDSIIDDLEGEYLHRKPQNENADKGALTIEVLADEYPGSNLQNENTDEYEPLIAGKQPANDQDYLYQFGSWFGSFFKSAEPTKEDRTNCCPRFHLGLGVM